ncbi:YajQ family cyclic di-GMP-binding protein [Cellvibrio sp.]|uniref:YajQ family cyclic di-GMP-binding protein n=1 Tax=Cellvibrio sp. TaxID=1965322 RepID=UPI00396474D3
MPSFDVVSEVDKHALTNAVDQASKVITSRYDFKGVDAKFERKEYDITITADTEYQLDAMLDSLRTALPKNGIGVSCLDIKKVQTAGKQVKRDITVRTGVETELAKKIVKMTKDQKLKVQASIQGDQVRITGKKRDDLQECIAMLRAAELEMPLQYINFRD